MNTYNLPSNTAEHDISIPFDQKLEEARARLKTAYDLLYKRPTHERFITWTQRRNQLQQLLSGTTTQIH